MNIEKEIFKRNNIEYNTLIDYGFIKEKNKYLISKEILDNTFRIDIEISKEHGIQGKIYDLSFGEEYTNHKIESQTGEFVNKIRNEYKEFLKDIRKKCTTKNYFLTPQANRISNMIKNKYHDTPDFAWTKFPGYGIFRNKNNEKWYALIMNINKNKIDNGNEEVEIINVKLDKKIVEELLQRKGFYKAYHMNKENWITILLDETLSDEEIMIYIEESHKITEKKDEWIIPANPKYYDIINCFNESDTVLWKQSNNIKKGDLVYLYVTIPYKAILYKCEAIEVDIPYNYRDKNISMKKVMNLKLQEKYNKEEFTFEVLKENGVKSIRGPRSMPEELSKKINS